MRAFNRSSGKELVRDLSVAASVFSRAKGLLGKEVLPQGEGLLIRPCKGVHTFLMKFPIDVIFLDKNNRIIAAIEDLPPQRMTRMLFSAACVLELPAGTVRASATVAGHEIVIVR